MNHSRSSRLIPLLAGLVLLPASVCLAADDSVMPPPSDVQDSETARQTAPAQEKAPNLGEELKGGSTKGQQVQIFSYQRKDGAKIQEYSLHGKVYMVKIQPAGGLPPYYLYDDNGDGNFQRRTPGGYKHLEPPQWVIKRF